MGQKTAKYLGFGVLCEVWYPFYQPRNIEERGIRGRVIGGITVELKNVDSNNPNNTELTSNVWMNFLFQYSFRDLFNLFLE